MIYLREKDLTKEEYLNLSLRVQKLCKNHQAKLILPANCEFLDQFQDINLQAGKNTPDLKSLRKRLGEDYKIGYSAHNLEEAKEAEKNGASYLFFSSIFSSPSKPDLKPIGLEALQNVCSQTKIPVYALGGITPQNISNIMEAGAYGIAAISSLQEKETSKLLVKYMKKYDQ